MIKKQTGKAIVAVLTTALQLAIKYSIAEDVKALLSHGADATVNDSQLLCQAVADGKNEIAELLIEAGADVGADDGDPLRIAFCARNYTMAKMLIKKGASIDDARLMVTVNRLNDLLLFNMLAN